MATGGSSRLSSPPARISARAFSVGYDPREQVIYLAVIVRDDSLIVGQHEPLGHRRGRGLRRRAALRHGPWPQRPTADYDDLDAGDCPCSQYIGLPGKGRVYGIMKSAGVERSGQGQPDPQFGDITKTKTRMAFRREGDVTTYEWAVQAFDHYPDKPTPAGLRA